MDLEGDGMRLFNVGGRSVCDREWTTTKTCISLRCSLNILHWAPSFNCTPMICRNITSIMHSILPCQQEYITKCKQSKQIKNNINDKYVYYLWWTCSSIVPCPWATATFDGCVLPYKFSWLPRQTMGDIFLLLFFLGLPGCTFKTGASGAANGIFCQYCSLLIGSTMCL